jgi:hypothetical protein
LNIRSLIDGAISLAHMGGELLPPLEGGAEVAEKLVDLVDSLKAHAPDDSSKAQLEQAHTALLKRMQDKGHALSSQLRG